MVRSSLLARTAARFEQILAEPAGRSGRPPAGRRCQGLRELAQLRGALTGPAMAALFDAPWLPLALVVALDRCIRRSAPSRRRAPLVLALLAVANDLLTRRARSDAPAAASTRRRR